jgi:hypothetical protein
MEIAASMNSSTDRNAPAWMASSIALSCSPAR